MACKPTNFQSMVSRVVQLQVRRCECCRFWTNPGDCLSIAQISMRQCHVLNALNIMWLEDHADFSAIPLDQLLLPSDQSSPQQRVRYT